MQATNILTRPGPFCLLQGVEITGAKHWVVFATFIPSYYGFHVALCCALPSIALLSLWMVFDDLVINSMVMSSLPAAEAPADAASYNLLLNKIANMADGICHELEKLDPVGCSGPDEPLPGHFALVVDPLILTLSLVGLAQVGREPRPGFAPDHC